MTDNEMRFVALMGTMLFWVIMFFLGIKAALTYFAIMVAIIYLWLKTENKKKDDHLQKVRG